MVRRRRDLGAEEEALWREVTVTVTPLVKPPKRRRTIRPVELLTEPAHDEAPVSAPTTTHPPKPVRKAKAPPQPVAEKPKKPALKPLVPLDLRTRRRIVRGSLPVTGRIDLHGLTQHEAFTTLRGFLVRAQMEDTRLVIVITGKGRPGADLIFDPQERGVLRRMVPHWLMLPDFRDLVSGFEEAGPPHGGAGALYVRVRRRRD